MPIHEHRGNPLTQVAEASEYPPNEQPPQPTPEQIAEFKAHLSDEMASRTAASEKESGETHRMVARELTRRSQQENFSHHFELRESHLTGTGGNDASRGGRTALSLEAEAPARPHFVDGKREVPGDAKIGEPRTEAPKTGDSKAEHGDAPERAEKGDPAHPGKDSEYGKRFIARPGRGPAPQVKADGMPGPETGDRHERKAEGAPDPKTDGAFEFHGGGPETGEGERRHEAKGTGKEAEGEPLPEHQEEFLKPANTKIKSFFQRPASRFAAPEQAPHPVEHAGPEHGDFPHAGRFETEGNVHDTPHDAHSVPRPQEAVAMPGEHKPMAHKEIKAETAGGGGDNNPNPNPQPVSFAVQGLPHHEVPPMVHEGGAVRLTGFASGSGRSGRGHEEHPALPAPETRELPPAVAPKGKSFFAKPEDQGGHPVEHGFPVDHEGRPVDHGKPAEHEDPPLESHPQGPISEARHPEDKLDAHIHASKPKSFVANAGAGPEHDPEPEREVHRPEGFKPIEQKHIDMPKGAAPVLVETPAPHDAPKSHAKVDNADKPLLTAIDAPEDADTKPPVRMPEPMRAALVEGKPVRFAEPGAVDPSERKPVSFAAKPEKGSEPHGFGPHEGGSVPWDRDEESYRIEKVDRKKAAEVDGHKEERLPPVLDANPAQRAHIDPSALYAQPGAQPPAQPGPNPPLAHEVVSMVDRFLVTADAGSYVKEVRMTLNPSVLPNTEIQFRQVGSNLVVTLVSEDGESADRLRSEGPELADALRAHTGDDVEVRLVTGVGAGAHQETL